MSLFVSPILGSPTYYHLFPNAWKSNFLLLFRIFFSLLTLQRCSLSPKLSTDYYQLKNHDAQPLAIGGYLPVSTVYSMEPVPAVSARNSSSSRYSVVFASFCCGVIRPTSTAVSTLASDITNSFIQFLMQCLPSALLFVAITSYC